MEDMKRVNVDGEEYVIVPICPMTVYLKSYTEGKTEEEILALLDSVRDVLGRGLYDYAEGCGALKRTDIVNRLGDTFIECRVKVLVKAQDWEESVRRDPERNFLK